MNLHPTRERVGQARQEQHVRRARQQKAAGPPIAIHGCLDRHEQLRRALDLVEDDGARETADEPRRVDVSGGQHGRWYRERFGTTAASTRRAWSSWSKSATRA